MSSRLCVIDTSTSKHNDWRTHTKRRVPLNLLAPICWGRSSTRTEPSIKTVSCFHVIVKWTRETKQSKNTTKKNKNSIHWVNSMRMRKSAHKCTVWHTFSWKIQFTPSRSSVMKGDELCWAPTPWPGIMLPQAVVGAPLGNPWIWWMGARISTNKTLTAAAQVNAAFWLYDMLKTECAADFLLYNIGQQLLYSWAAALRCAVLVYSLGWCVVYTPRARTEERETPHDLGWYIFLFEKRKNESRK